MNEKIGLLTQMEILKFIAFRLSEQKYNDRLLHKLKFIIVDFLFFLNN